MIDLTIHPDRMERAVQRARERNIIIPTFKQQREPNLIPDRIKAELRKIGLWELNSSNLFRITWRNEPVDFGGRFGDVNYMEFPVLVDRRGCTRPRAGGQVVSDRRAQGRRGVRLSCAPAGHRPVRPHHAESRLAFHRATIAAAGRTIRRCWRASPSPSCRKG